MSLLLGYKKEAHPLLLHIYTTVTMSVTLILLPVSLITSERRSISLTDLIGLGKDWSFIDGALFIVAMDCFFFSDSTPNYMRSPERDRKGYDESGMTEQLKIFFSLRNLDHREISIYNHMAGGFHDMNPPPDWISGSLTRNGTLMQFEEYVEIIIMKDPKKNAPRDMHHDLLQRWFKHFDRQQILLLSFDEIVANETSFLQRVHSFLDSEVNGQLKLPHSNGKNAHGHGMKRGKVSCELQERLGRTFEPTIPSCIRFLNRILEHNGSSFHFPDSTRSAIRT